MSVATRIRMSGHVEAVYKGGRLLARCRVGMLERLVVGHVATRLEAVHVGDRVIVMVDLVNPDQSKVIGLRTRAGQQPRAASPA